MENLRKKRSILLCFVWTVLYGGLTSYFITTKLVAHDAYGLSVFVENIVNYRSFLIKYGIVCLICSGLYAGLFYLNILQKRLIGVIGIILFIGIVSDLAIGVDEQIQLRRNNQGLYADLKEEIFPGIVCWGDSLTAGADSDYACWPEEMRRIFANELTEIPVVNMGIGGEDSITIIGRSGAMPFTIGKVSLPKVETSDIEAEIPWVEVEVFTANGERAQLFNGEVDTGINPCYINGILCKLVAEDMIPTEEKKVTTKKTISETDRRYYLKRLQIGDSVEIPTGTILKTAAFGKYQDMITILFVGQNGGYDDIPDLIAQQNALIESMSPGNDRYLVISPTGGTEEERHELEEAMLAEYGETYLNLREWLCTEAVDIAVEQGMELTAEDQICIQKGMVPESFRKDIVHYNELATPLIARRIYDKLEELGYLENLRMFCQKYPAAN